MMDPRRILKMGPKRLLQKTFCFDEIYTIALRKKGSEEAFTMVPNQPDTWMADPLITTWNGKDYLYAEVFDQHTNRGHISYAMLSEDPLQFHAVLEEPYHMSFPMIFTWNGQYYLIPETSENHSINLYQAEQMPGRWKRLKSFPTKGLIVDSVVLSIEEDKVHFLASESDPENGLRCRFVKYSIQKSNGDYQLHWDTEFNSSQNYNYQDRCAGPLVDGAILPVQISTDLDYGVSIQFWNLKEKKVEQVLNRDNTDIHGIPADRIIGIHTWSQGKDYEAIDARYLKKDVLLNMHRLERRFR